MEFWLIYSDTDLEITRAKTAPVSTLKSNDENNKIKSNKRKNNDNKYYLCNNNYGIYLVCFQGLGTCKIAVQKGVDCAFTRVLHSVGGGRRSIGPPPSDHDTTPASLSGVWLCALWWSFFEPNGSSPMWGIWPAVYFSGPGTRWREGDFGKSIHPRANSTI